jgi:hypothetical protein
MNKQDRLNLIANLAKKHILVPLVEAGKSDIKEEIDIALTHNDDNSIVDIEEMAPGVSKQLIHSLDNSKLFKTNKNVDSAILTNEERKRLKREIEEYRKINKHKYTLALPFVSVFSNISFVK